MEDKIVSRHSKRWMLPNKLSIYFFLLVCVQAVYMVMDDEEWVDDLQRIAIIVGIYIFLVVISLLEKIFRKRKK